MGVIINGNEYQAEKFAWDGCHKIYLVESVADEEEAVSIGYKLYGITDLPDIWRCSCPLRFIRTWSLDSVVPQCFEDEVTFEFVN